MRIGCCAYSFRRYLTSGEMSLEGFIDLAADTGFDGVELTSYYFPSTEPSYLHEVKRRCMMAGVAVAGAAVGSRLTLADEEERAEQIRLVMHWISSAVELGAPELRVFAGNVPEGHTEEDAFRWAVDALADCVEVAASRGVVLALENHGGITGTADQVTRIIEAVDSPWLRLNLDTGGFQSGDAYQQIEQTAGLAVTAHMKATVNMPDGESPVDLERAISILHRAGYRGYLNIEYSEDEDPMVAVPRMAGEMRRLVENL